MTTYNSPFTGDVVQPTDVSYISYTISANLTLEWPVNGNVGNVAARIMEINATVASLSVFMPPANEVSVGQDALITNTGANTFTVKDANGNTIVSVASGNSQYIYITNNSTVSGTWADIAFGATTSVANAALLAGNGLLAIGSTLNQSHPSSPVSNGGTFAVTDRALTMVWDSGTGSATLGTVATLGNNWFILFKNNGTGTFTINCSGSDEIDGQPSKIFQPNESAIIVCTGNDFVTIGYGVSTDFAFTSIVKSVTSGSYNITPSEASSVIQEYVGTLTGNVTAVYPAVVGLYVISNQTTAGGYSLTITTGIGGAATAVVPSGQQATVICDGTNFLNANTIQAGASSTSLANGTVGAPSLNFASEANSGIYRPGAGNMGFSILGTQRMNISAAGIQVTGVGYFSSGVGGGTF
jgi:hypothetical protein